MGGREPSGSPESSLHRLFVPIGLAAGDTDIIRSRLAPLIALALVAAACTGGGDRPAPTRPQEPTTTTTAIPPTTIETLGFPGVPLLADGPRIPPAPDVPEGPLDEAIVADLDAVFSTLTTGADIRALVRISEAGDARTAWLMSDLLRFFEAGPVAEVAEVVFERMTGVDIPAEERAWVSVTNLLLAWDLPAPPGYLDWKRIVYEIVEPGWEPFFADEDADIDWRLVSWGGLLIDDRPPESTRLPCAAGCIPSLNDPAVTDAVGGDWYPDERLVFGVVVENEARAYPKHIMEVHEIVNDALGGRRIGVPYCTRCGSAQAYFTDDVPPAFESLELRTTGLLSRSNKMMFDLHTFSMIDTFTGKAVTGPLQDEGYTLEMISVVTSSWGAWKEAHPDTSIVARDGGIGRSYPLDSLQGRDDEGPIFPIGEVDPRLPVQELVVGVVAPDGTPLAFPVAEVRSAIENGDRVGLAGAVVVPEAGGFRVMDVDGEPLASHQAFWFAWSQSRPETLVWAP